MKDKPNFYAVIPATVRYDESLSSSQKLFYAEITAMSQKEGYCWASNSYFSELYGVANSTVSSWVTGLKEKGHVIVEYEKTGKNIDKRLIYPIQKIEYPYSEKQHTPIQKNSIPYSENPKENNTRFNNTSNNTTRDVSTNVHDVPNASDSVTWESSIKVANYLLESICQYDTTHKYNFNEPSLDRWVKDIDRAIRLDGRTEDQLMYLINYIYRQNGKHSSFWAGNIESGSKLREQFDKIKNQIKSEKTNGRTHGDYNQKLAETEKFLDQYYSESN